MWKPGNFHMRKIPHEIHMSYVATKGSTLVYGRMPYTGTYGVPIDRA